MPNPQNNGCYSFLCRKSGPNITKPNLLQAFQTLLTNIQKQELEQFDIIKFKVKQMQLSQLMGLKTKGRFL